MDKNLYSNERVYIIAETLEEAKKLWGYSLFYLESDNKEFQQIDNEEMIEIKEGFEEHIMGILKLPVSTEWMGGENGLYYIWRTTARKWASVNMKGYLGEVI
jgi:hypothetical protein